MAEWDHVLFHCTALRANRDVAPARGPGPRLGRGLRRPPDARTQPFGPDRARLPLGCGRPHH
ncbi:hypothetical protein ACFFX0_01670 [Citricoccus parietis]|uniref:Uncharacterized protein n=1 Tax=Citricoccus parietis TaxID=592307 RepID=A0ABV5FTH4_9MICC